MARLDLLICDELGYLPMDSQKAKNFLHHQRPKMVDEVVSAARSGPGGRII
ncbi:MAG: hypothetical protein M1299_13180 [Firmicutes bacterium]|nr:hypothetical protein [Bacillota bacterium]MCL5040742.1 hypothetical protein [Bacillota bacterium]